MKATSKRQKQLALIYGEVLPLLRAVCDGYAYIPGDDEEPWQHPIHVRLTLGDYRRARRLKAELEASA